jgi:hypothetical protein
MKHFCAKKKVWGPLCASGAGFVPFPCQNGGCTHAWVQKCDSKPKLNHFFCSQTLFGLFRIHYSKKKGGAKVRPQMTRCAGLFAGRKWCISGNPGNTLSGHHLSVGIFQYAPRACPVKYYGLECWRWAVVGSNS